MFITSLPAPLLYPSFSVTTPVDGLRITNDSSHDVYLQHPCCISSAHARALYYFTLNNKPML